MESQAIQLQKERLERLQGALQEAYPELYKKNRYKIKDCPSLAIAGINECEVICQLLLDIEEGRSLNEDKHLDLTKDKGQEMKHYVTILNHQHNINQNDLIKKLGDENEFQKKLIDKLNEQISLLKQFPQAAGRQPSNQTPGNRLQQRYGHQSMQHIPFDKLNEVQSIERDIKHLKSQYQCSKRNFFLDSEKKNKSQEPTTRSHNTFSQERLQKYKIEELKSKTIINLSNSKRQKQGLNKTTGHAFANNEIDVLKTMTKQDLIQEVVNLYQQVDRNNNQGGFQIHNNKLPLKSLGRSNSGTAMHTSHRAHVKQASQLQQELKDLEKRHLLIVKDFSKLQDERMKILREKDQAYIKINLLEQGLAEITHNMLSLIEGQSKLDGMSQLTQKYVTLQDQNRKNIQMIQEKDLQIMEFNKQITDLNLQIEQQNIQVVDLQQNQKMEDTLQREALIFDYGLPRSPRINKQLVNKEVQCEEELNIITDQKYLLGRYDSLKEENSSLRRGYESVSHIQSDYKERVKSLIASVLDLKQVVVLKYLNSKDNSKIDSKQSKDKIKIEELDDFNYYEEVVRQIKKIITSIPTGQENNSQEETNSFIKSKLSQKISGHNSTASYIQSLAQQFEETIEIQKIPTQNLPHLDTQQRILNDLIGVLDKFKSNEETYLIQIQILKDKIKVLKGNTEQIKQTLGNTEQNKSLLEVNQQQLTQILKLKKHITIINKENTNEALQLQDLTNKTYKRNDISSHNSRASSKYKSVASPIQSKKDAEDIALVQTYNFQQSENATHQALSPFRQEQLASHFNQSTSSQAHCKSPIQNQTFTDKKMSYMNLKFKEGEKLLERKIEELKEKDFLLRSIQDEVERKSGQILNFQGLVEEMNMKLNQQNDYIEKLEKANKDTVLQYQIELQKHKRDHEKTIKNVVETVKSQENEEFRFKRSKVIEQNKQENESVQKSIILLKGQYEREKKMVEEKVRELTVLQSSSVSEQDLRRENNDLKNLTSEMNKIITEERQMNEQQKLQFNEQISTLRDKISSIEYGCAHQVVMALRNLRDDINIKVDGANRQDSMVINQQETVEMIIKDVVSKINQIVKQRENLQKAINAIQCEKQQLMIQVQQQATQYPQNNMNARSMQYMGSMMNKSLSQRPQQLQQQMHYNQQPMIGAIQTLVGPGNISRMMNPLDQSLPQIIQSHSPQKLYTMNSQYGLHNRSMKNQGQNIFYQNALIMQDNQEGCDENMNNLYEYLQAEVVAAREKKDQLQSKNQGLQKQVKELELRVQSLDILAKNENIETYQQLLSNVREVLGHYQQEYLLEDIISHPLKYKQKNSRGIDNNNAVDNSSITANGCADESVMIFKENSTKLINDLEALLPLIGKCFCMLLLEKNKFTDQLKTLEKQNNDLRVQRNEELDMLASREIEDKTIIKQLESRYKQELEHLKVEKDLLVAKTKDFSKNLQILQKDNVNKKETINILKQELAFIKEESKDIENKVRRDVNEKFEINTEQRLAKVRDESYYKGRKDASEEMTIENKKLREIIDSLRAETSTKGKKLIETQYEVEELQRAKKKNSGEVDELYQKLSREREGQKELQQRLDGLLQEVSYLKNMSRQMHSQQ